MMPAFTVQNETPSAYNPAGGVFMLRRNWLLGWVAAALGVGILIGLWIECNFMSHCIGLGLLALGCGSLCKK